MENHKKLIVRYIICVNILEGLNLLTMTNMNIVAIRSVISGKTAIAIILSVLIGVYTSIPLVIVNSLDRSFESAIETIIIGVIEIA